MSKYKKLKKRIDEAFMEISILDGKPTCSFEHTTLDVKNAISFSQKTIIKNKWYVCDDDFLFFYNDGPLYYGFINGKWNEGISFGFLFKNIRIATEEEVKTALINEAEKRGFKEGTVFKSALTGNKFTFEGEIKFYPNYNTLIPQLGCIFHNGKWAEIVSQPKEEPKEIDWSKPGQLFKSEDGIVIINDGNYESKVFSGTVLKSENSWPDGYYSNAWNKSVFLLYNKTLTLCNP